MSQLSDFIGSKLHNFIDNVGQNTIQSAGNPLNGFVQPVAQAAGQAFSGYLHQGANPLQALGATVQQGIQSVPNIPQVAAPIANLPFLGGVAQVGRSILNAYPQSINQGIVNAGNDVRQGFEGNPASLAKIGGDFGQAMTIPLTIASTGLGQAGAAGLKGLPLSQQVIQGALAGARTSAPFAIQQGLTAAKDTKSLPDWMKAAGGAAAKTEAIGIAGGAAAPLVGAAVKGIAGHVQDAMGNASPQGGFVSLGDNRVLDDLLQKAQSGTITPDESKMLFQQPEISQAVHETAADSPEIAKALYQGMQSGDTRGVLTIINSKLPQEFQGSVVNADAVNGAPSVEDILAKVAHDQSGKLDLGAQVGGSPDLNALGEPYPATPPQTQDVRKSIDYAIAKANEPPPPKIPPNLQDAFSAKDIANAGHAARSEVMSKIQARAQNIAYDAGTNIKGGDQYLFAHALEHPEDADSVAQLAQDPGKFSDLVKKYSDFTDYVFQQAKDSNTPLRYVKDYYTHLVDTSDPADAARLDAYITANSKNFVSGFTKQRFFNNIEDLTNAGFKVDLNPQNVINQYAHSMGKQIGYNASFKAMNDLAPNVAMNSRETGGVPIDVNTHQAYTQAQVPGGQAEYIRPDVAKYFNKPYGQSAFADNPVVQVADKIGAFGKSVKLAGGLFHALREGGNYTFQQMASGNVPDLKGSAAAFVSPDYFAQAQQDAIDNGIVDTAAHMGVKFDTAPDISSGEQDLAQGLTSAAHTGGVLNPANWKDATIRMINFQKLKIVENLPEEAQTPAVGAQVNNLMGGLNREIANINPTTWQAARLVFLAPDFNWGKIGTVAGALQPNGSPQATFARQALIGTSIGVGVEAELMRRVLTGHFSQNVKDAVMNNFVKPSVPLPYKSPTGKMLQAGLPGTDVSDIGSAVSDAVTADNHVPQHFLTSRLSAPLSLGAQLVTGKDYYGNPLRDPFEQHPNLLKDAANVAQSQLPIPVVNALKAMRPGSSGKPSISPTTAALNTLGLRVSTDPSDPSMQYFNKLDAIRKGLNPNDLANFNSLHPVTKDRTGNSVVDKNEFTTPDKYVTLLNNPNVLKAEIALQTAQNPHDPLWDLPPDQLRNYLWAESQKQLNPTAGFRGQSLPGVSAALDSLPPNFFQQRSDFFNSLNLPPNPNSTHLATPPGVTDFWNQYYALPAGNRRKAFLQTPEGQTALQFASQQQTLTNQQRASMGIPLLATAPTSTSPTSIGTTAGGSSSKASGPKLRKPPKPRLPSISFTKRVAGGTKIKLRAPKASVTKIKMAKLKPIKLTNPKF